ncbi:flagellar export chaperone FliS [Thermoanaerobacterium sp. DL9XJH110]|uniref:flagellar export chaperone FliS n=1 Tax=Thermoanaerobacterium sp. DL9XJH110 TaxID=3386643 RepID=UPI003BB7FD2D
MLYNPYMKYQQIQVETASQERLILMMYDGAIKFIKLGKEAIEKRDFSSANEYIKRAEDIVLELKMSLNMDAGGIAKNLSAVYDYLYSRLIEANFNKDTEMLEEVLNHLTDFRNTWVEVFKRAKNP